jgi:hypothetical protein
VSCGTACKEQRQYGSSQPFVCFYNITSWYDGTTNVMSVLLSAVQTGIMIMAERLAFAADWRYEKLWPANLFTSQAYAQTHATICYASHRISKWRDTQINKQFSESRFRYFSCTLHFPFYVSFIPFSWQQHVQTQISNPISNPLIHLFPLSKQSLLLNDPLLLLSLISGRDFFLLHLPLYSSGTNFPWWILRS